MECKVEERLLDLHVATEDVGAILVIRLAGEVGEAAAETLRARLLGMLHDGRKWLVIDVSGVTSMDAVTLTALASAHEYARARHGWVRLAGPNRPVRQALGVTGIGELLPVYPTVHAATAEATTSESEPPEPVG